MKSIDHNFDVSKEFDLADLPNEIWKDIPNYEGLYQVSNLGRVKGIQRIDPLGRYHAEKIKNQNLWGQYYRTGLCKDSYLKYFSIHRLVALAFIPNSDNLPQVDHINTIKTDNRVENLHWVTASGNMNNPLTVKQLSDVNKGKKMSEEACKKMRENHADIRGEKNPFYHKKHTEEAKEKMRIAHYGGKAVNARKVINLDTNQIFDCVQNAGRFYNITSNSIRYSIKNHYRCAGFYWGYYKE